MKFYRPAKVRHNIQVIPMIDILLILLIYFAVSTVFKKPRDVLPEGLLESYLTAYQKQNPGRKLELEADKKLPLERLLTVWDALTKAGIPIKEVPARIKLKD